MRRAVVAVLLVMFVLLAACRSNGSASRPANALTPVGDWRLIALEGEAVELPDGARLPTMTIGQDGSIAGMAGVNRFSGSVDPEGWADDGWVMGPLAMTRMDGPPEAMAFEQRFVELLERAEFVYPWPRTMDLVEGGAFVLRFERVAP